MELDLKKITTDLAKEICLWDLHGKLPSKAWTGKVKEHLFNAALAENSMDIKCECSRRPEGEEWCQEFMLDLIWWKKTFPQEMLLAVESEWSDSPEEVERDFWKLLTVKSRYKLMLVCGNGLKGHESRMKRIQKCFREYGDHRESEEYVILDSQSGMQWKAMHIRVDSDGICEKEFSPFLLST